MNEDKLRSFIKQIITEQEDPKKDPDKKAERRKKKVDTKPGEVGVTAGKGRWSKSIGEAGALAEEAPDELMDNLGVSKKTSGFKGVKSIITQAIAGNGAMKKSYSGMSNVSQGKMTGIQIKMGELDSRNGAKYLHHTLIGALNADMLSLDIPIQIDRLDSGTVVVYSSPMKNSWTPKKEKKKEDK